MTPLLQLVPRFSKIHLSQNLNFLIIFSLSIAYGKTLAYIGSKRLNNVVNVGMRLITCKWCHHPSSTMRHWVLWLCLCLFYPYLNVLLICLQNI